MDLAVTSQVTYLALSSGITVKVPLQRFMSFVGAKKFDYQLRLSTSGTKVKVESVAIAP